MKKRENLKLAAYVLAAFFAGAGASVFYIFKDPIRIQGNCAFVLPNAFNIPRAQ